MVLSWSAPGFPQDKAAIAAAEPPSTVAASPAPDSQAGIVIPPLTPVHLVLKEHMGSKVSTGGQSFTFELAEPVMIDGKQAVAAGTPGVGEVVHAKKSGASGSSGELVLAARYLQVGDRHLRLRSLQTVQTSQDKIGTVTALSPAIGVFGLLVKGKEVDLPEGTVVSAKTAEAFTVEAPQTAPSIEPGPEAATATAATTTPTNP